MVSVSAPPPYGYYKRIPVGVTLEPVQKHSQRFGWDVESWK